MAYDRNASQHRVRRANETLAALDQLRRVQSAESVAASQELEFRAQRSRAHSRPVAKPTGSQLERAAGAKMAPPRTAHGPRGVGGPLRVSSPSSPGGPNGQPRQIERQRGDISNHKRLVRLHVPGGWRHTPLGWFFEADFER